ncbi:MAG: hypothetical protein RMK29_08020 [Myxococcales bacterium]|nr:hypothetical protein [Myxococcota bacterium]MDW8281639.1 hypothetical protein [Myxococcales bacterium]
MRGWLLSLLCSLLACHGAGPPPEVTRADARRPPDLPDPLVCCQQCLEASARDPIGMDLSMVPCLRYRGEFNGGPGVDGACAALFERQGTRVGQCQDLLKQSGRGPDPQGHLGRSRLWPRST